MKRIKLTFLLALVSLIGAVGAHAAVTANQVLDNVVKTMQSAPSLSFNMTVRVGGETFGALLNVAREKFNYAAGDMTVFYDGQTQWTVDNSAGEVSLTNPTAEELIETNPLSFVSSYKANYNVTMLKAPAGQYKVKMVARKKSSYVRSAEVTVDAKTWLPTSVTALLATGQTMTVHVASANRGNALPVSSFRFDTKKHPDIEVIDLR